MDTRAPFGSVNNHYRQSPDIISNMNANLNVIKLIMFSVVSSVYKSMTSYVKIHYIYVSVSLLHPAFDVFLKKHYRQCANNQMQILRLIKTVWMMLISRFSVVDYMILAVADSCRKS